MTVRDASTRWTGDLQTGSGITTLDSSGTAQFAVTFPQRVGEPEGTTSPEELIAAAHSACFSMALSGGLGRAGTPPTSLTVSAEVELDRVDGQLAITAVRLHVDGVVPGMDQAQFAAAAAEAKDGCPVSRALAGVASISVEATLLPG
ncbi:MAG TPA: OsmC family peroxiredoxin [Candidatus Nanopelagicales bacterium]|nr:OsmC family peroxiredoxin [Candidatus Nanopelagicales bacterium]